jgi:flagellar basal-body rod protein FlgF
MPINGLTRAAHALSYYERRQEVVANNLANADTNGFRAERVFARLLEGELPVIDTRTDFQAGALKQTGNPLDIALGGEGFFVVETPEGERLTRGGSFQLDAERRIVDAHGNPLMGEDGPITVPMGAIAVDDRGTISVEGREVARIRLEKVPRGTALQHAGGTQFLPDEARAPLEPGERVVRQGYLEDSNVSTVGSMVDMISIQRAYAAVQRTITTLDGVRGTIANELGKPV